MKKKEFLVNYLNNPSPVGFEESGQKIWLDYIGKFVDKTYVDAYGTAVAVINPEAEYKVVIEAHADEISWLVNYIQDDGYIRVIRNGGSDIEIAPSMRVNIHGEKGVVPGVFGWPAIHVRDYTSTSKHKLEDLFIDVGASSKKDVEKLGINVGTVITFVDEFFELNKDFYTGRALDNRIGGYMIAQVAKKLKEDEVELPFGLYIVNAVQEEIGLRGAEMIAASIKPNLAIVTDVCHDTSSPMYNKNKQGDTKCGDGPVLTIGPSIHKDLFNLIVAVAEDNKIKFQRMAAGRYTGTDTDAFAYSSGGIPSALISLPLRYMHTTVETVHKDDVKAVIKLMFEFVKAYKSEI
jgi:putative aminopeptidase FrvX